MTNDGAKPPVARLLRVGAKRAGRVAQVTGVDRALDEAVEEAIVRALRSPAIGRAIERAMEDRAATISLDADAVAGMVKEVLESEAARHAWDEVLASEEAQMLVERIAGAPEIRAAIAEQSAGLITDIGIRLTKLTEALDDAVERIVSPRNPDRETDQAGSAFSPSSPRAACSPPSGRWPARPPGCAFSRSASSTTDHGRSAPVARSSASSPSPSRCSPRASAFWPSPAIHRAGAGMTG